VAGWRGVYVPKTLAVGLTPVTWRSYLNQQRRWARSVIDIKFRVYPRVARRLPRTERLVSLFHGLYYFHGLTTAIGTAVIGYMLATGAVPPVFSMATVPYVLPLLAALLASDFFRQRFFLNPGERGIHWRAGLLRFAKWPTTLLALKDALRPRRAAYTLTPKTRQAPKRSLVVVPHALTAAFLLGAGVLGRLEHVHATALWSVVVLQIGLSVIVMATTLKSEPPPYDPSLRGRDHGSRDRVDRPRNDSSAVVATHASSGSADAAARR
jgi:hypothetical protein